MPATPLRVTVVGGGFAAAELLLALRALAADGVELELIAPDTRLPLRMASTGEPFGAAVLQTFDLADLCRDVGATVRRGTVEAVAARAHRVRLASGATADYDALVLAVGARATVGVPGALTFRDHRDRDRLRGVVDAVAAGDLESIAFAAPTGVAWTLPLYELALLTAAEVAGTAAQVAVVTPERRALQVFGTAVSDAVEALLADRDIRLVTAAYPWRATRERLELRDGWSLAADRVVAAPRLAGRAIAGIPQDWNGFVPTDPWGRVPERPDVFAAGDMTAFPLKQGGVAAQQADVIARVLAVRAGARIGAAPAPTYTLRSRLFGADGPLYLRAALDGEGRPVAGAGAVPAVSREAEWWPGAKVFGRYLTPWMARASGTEMASAA